MQLVDWLERSFEIRIGHLGILVDVLLFVVVTLFSYIAKDCIVAIRTILNAGERFYSIQSIIMI